MAVSENKEQQGLFNQLLQVLHETAPRSIEATRRLSALGLGLLAIKITRLSTVVGYRSDQIPLPDHARIICLGRDGEAYYPGEAGRMSIGDTVFVLHEQGREAEIREIFTSPAPVCEIPRPEALPWPPRDFFEIGPQSAD